MSGFVSVGFTPQTTDICVCRWHAENVVTTCRQHSVTTCRQHSVMSAIFLAIGVMSVRPVAHTHSYMQVGISNNEVVTYEDEKLECLSPIFVLLDFSSSQRIQHCKQKKASLRQGTYLLLVSQNKSKKWKLETFSAWWCSRYAAGWAENTTTNLQRERQRQLMLGKRGTGQQLTMVSKRGWRPSGKKHQQSHDSGGWQLWMADNAAGEGRQMTQQSTIDRLAKAAAMVTAEARARAW